jgi:hypothetical protein
MRSLMATVMAISIVLPQPSLAIAPEGRLCAIHSVILTQALTAPAGQTLRPLLMKVHVIKVRIRDLLRRLTSNDLEPPASGIAFALSFHPSGHQLAERFGPWRPDNQSNSAIHWVKALLNKMAQDAEQGMSDDESPSEIAFEASRRETETALRKLLGETFRIELTEQITKILLRLESRLFDGWVPYARALALGPGDISGIILTTWEKEDPFQTSVEGGMIGDAFDFPTKRIVVKTVQSSIRWTVFRAMSRARFDSQTIVNDSVTEKQIGLIVEWLTFLALETVSPAEALQYREQDFAVRTAGASALLMEASRQQAEKIFAQPPKSPVNRSMLQAISRFLGRPIEPPLQREAPAKSQGDRPRSITDRIADAEALLSDGFLTEAVATLDDLLAHLERAVAKPQLEPELTPVQIKAWLVYVQRLRESVPPYRTMSLRELFAQAAEQAIAEAPDPPTVDELRERERAELATRRVKASFPVAIHPDLRECFGSREVVPFQFRGVVNVERLVRVLERISPSLRGLGRANWSINVDGLEFDGIYQTLLPEQKIEIVPAKNSWLAQYGPLILMVAAAFLVDSVHRRTNVEPGIVFSAILPIHMIGWLLRRFKQGHVDTEVVRQRQRFSSTAHLKSMFQNAGRFLRIRLAALLVSLDIGLGIIAWIAGLRNGPRPVGDSQTPSASSSSGASHNASNLLAAV